MLERANCARAPSDDRRRLLDTEAGDHPEEQHLALFRGEDRQQGFDALELFDVAWRPGACDEGLIVGSDNGTSWSPTFGTIIRFYDADDPACSP